MLIPEKQKVGLLYFLWIASSAAWFPMINLYFEKIGFTGMQIGILASIIPVTMLIGQPFVSIIADKYDRRKIMILVLITTAVIILGLLLKGNFVYFFIMMTLFSLSYAPINPLVDSTVLDFIEVSPGTSYSRMRMWGSIGWMSCTYITGYILTDRGLYWIFIIGSFLLAATALLASRVKQRRNTGEDLQMSFKDAGKVITDPKVLVFLVVLLFYGIGTIPINTFYSIYLNKIGASSKLIGLSFAIQAFSELPFLFYGSSFVKRFGALKIIALSLLVSGIRILCYTQISNPYVAICLDVSNGICYSLFLVGAVEYLNDIIPSQWRATGQSLLWAAYYGAGLIIGNLLTGFWYQHTSIQGAFLVDGLILLATSVMPFAMHRHYQNTE